MNVFEDVGFRLRFKRCWDLFADWQEKELYEVPVEERDFAMYENYPAARSILNTFTRLDIHLKLRDELLFMCELCCSNEILAMMMIRHICDTIAQDDLLPMDFEITSDAFMWVFPQWPLVQYCDTYVGGALKIAGCHYLSTGERWYSLFANMMADQRDFKLPEINRCMTKAYWDEVIDDKPKRHKRKDH